MLYRIKCQSPLGLCCVITEPIACKSVHGLVKGHRQQDDDNDDDNIYDIDIHSLHYTSPSLVCLVSING